MDLKMLPYSGLSILILRNHTNENHNRYELCPYSKSQHRKVVKHTFGTRQWSQCEGDKSRYGKELLRVLKKKSKRKKESMVTI